MDHKLVALLLVLLLAGGCTAILDLPPSSASPAASDFTPCSGYGVPPPGEEGRPGPWANRLMIAYSDDGLTWTRANLTLSDQAAVPDAIVDEDGVLRVYYVTWCPQEVHNQTVVALSPDGGETWSYRRVTINGLDAGQPSAVDPDIVRTGDGRWRLYFTTAPAEPGATPRTYSAISDDGFTFAVEEGYRLYVEDKAVLDPSLLRIGDEWHLFAGGAVSTPGYNWHATSSDGLNFTQQDDFSADNMMMANGLAVEGGYRFYGFTSDIRSLFTTDGVTWTVDPGVRLSLDTTAGLEALSVADPAVARLTDGRYAMIYATVIPEYLEPDGSCTELLSNGGKVSQITKQEVRK